MIDLKPFETISYVVLRIASGVLFTFHGMQKLIGVLSTRPTVSPHWPPDLQTQLWIGGLIELVGGIMIALGLLTRGAAFVASGTMAVAYIQFHWKGELGEKFFPVVNQGELALIYCFLFLFITFRGADAASIDRLIFGKRRA